MKRGNVGTLMTVMILGLLMTISAAYFKMINMESEIQSLHNSSDKAFDAAFSGVQYALAVAQSHEEMYLDDVGQVRNRPYFYSPTDSPDWDPTALAFPADFNASKLYQSDWFYYNGDFACMKNYAGTPRPYLFRICTFASSTAADLTTSEYIIKSQGRFLNLADDYETILDESHAQIRAVIQIDFMKKRLLLKSWKIIPYQGDDTDFFNPSS